LSAFVIFFTKGLKRFFGEEQSGRTDGAADCQQRKNLSEEVKEIGF
jgi:hypothetical protein